MSDAVLTIVAPDLLLPPPETPVEGEYPYLTRLLSRADILAAESDTDTQLLALFGLPSEAPLTPLLMLGEGLDPGNDIWMQATPVYLKADLANLLLFDGADLGITPDEAKALVELFNHHFFEEKIELIAPHPARWYLRLSAMPDLNTQPLRRVVGRSPSAALPTGADASCWQARLTEVEMLFHQASVNQQRTEQGRVVINGLWLHGAGCLPQVTSPPFNALVGEGVLAQGLARATGLGSRSWSEQPKAGELRLFLAAAEARRQGDAEGWWQAVADFDHWLAQVWSWLAAMPASQIRLFTGDGRVFFLNGRHRRRFWRRTRHLQAFLPKDYAMIH